MFELDQLLDGLTVEVQPFAICEARGASVIDLGAREQATLHYVLAGSGTFTMAGFPDIESRGGTIMITPRLLSHKVWAAPNGECQTLACAPLGSDWRVHQVGDGDNGIIVACSQISVGYRGVEGLFDYLHAPLICHLDDTDSVKLALEQILSEFATPKPGSRSLVRALMQQCMIHILRETNTQEPTRLQWLTAARDGRLWRTFTSIFDHPEAPHTLDSLAEMARMSRSSFADHFKQTFGRGAIDLLKEARLLMAARLLVSTDLSIKTITRDVGYVSRSHLSRAFIEHFGLSPADYRDAYLRPGP
jgi:AraC family transcriptional regulator, activator of mtrCDE